MPNTEKEIFMHRNAVLSREHALAKAQAAEEMGGKVIALANEGEPYTYKNPRTGNVYRGTVPEGHVYTKVAGMFPASKGMGDLNARTADHLAVIQEHRE